MDLKNKQLTFFDIFSGIGGFKIALERAGFKSIGFCDNDEYANKLYRAYFQNDKELFFDDVTTINTAELPDFDILCAGFPCQSFSIAGKRGGYYTHLQEKDNIYLQKTTINPISLIKYVDKVYVCTTQFGFEALMCGKEVHTFGMPFYAGWGLTIDEQICHRRNNTRTLEEVFYIAYILYSHYVNPETNKPCEIEEAIDYLLRLRDEYALYRMKKSNI